MSSLSEIGSTPPPRPQREQTSLPLESLTPAQVAQYVSPALMANCMEFAIALTDETMNGEELSKLTTGRLVRKSALASVVSDDRVAHSLFAKEIRLLKSQGVNPPQLMEDIGHAEQNDNPWSKTSNLAQPLWDTMSVAKLSDDGSSGVVFCQTDAGTYVVKPGHAKYAWREAMAYQLAVCLGMPTPKIRVVCDSDPEHKEIFRGLWRLSKTDDDLKYKLWNTWHRLPFVFVMEYVMNAQLLAGCGRTRAKSILDPSTDAGAARLKQLGWIICIDALCNNQDRVPVVHSNVGNGNNVMFSEGGTGDVMAIDGTVQPIGGSTGTLRQGSRGSQRTADLAQDYKSRVRAWLRACFKLPKEAVGDEDDKDDIEAELSMLQESSNTVEIAESKRPEACSSPEEASTEVKLSLQEKTVEMLRKEYLVDEDTAKACVEAAQFDVAGRSWIFASSPELRDYARKRGVNAGGADGSGGAGSLVSVRDFCTFMTGGGCDIGERGCEFVRNGVCEAATAVANKLTAEGLEGIHSTTSGMVVALDVTMRSALRSCPWEAGRGEVEFLSEMVDIFRRVCSEAGVISNELP